MTKNGHLYTIRFYTTTWNTIHFRHATLVDQVKRSLEDKAAPSVFANPKYFTDCWLGSILEVIPRSSQSGQESDRFKKNIVIIVM